MVAKRTKAYRPPVRALPPPKLMGFSCLSPNRFAVVDYPAGTPAVLADISGEQHARAAAALVRALSKIDGMEELNVFIAIPRFLIGGLVVWAGDDDLNRSDLDSLFLWLADMPPAAAGG